MTAEELTGISEFFTQHLGCKVRKIAVNASLGCPNRDGTLSLEGCSYCNNAGFNPAYALTSKGSISSQIDAGIAFQGKKAEGCACLAYFQSFSNTYGDTSRLIELYEEALSHPSVKGLVIATRPDCLDCSLMDYFEKRFGRLAPEGHPFLLLELGIESTNDRTLERINRGHDYDCAKRAVLELDRRGILCGAHIILGLPEENHDDFMSHARRLSELPISTLKLHQLQILRGTSLAREYEKDPEAFRLFSVDTYVETVVEFIRELRPGIALDRFVSESPSSLLLAPRWGIKPSVVNELIFSRVRQNNERNR